MLSFDTNVAVHAANISSPSHEAALEFLTSLGTRSDVVVSELMLVELYLKLRNERIFRHPLGASAAATVCQTYRNNASWKLVDTAPVMDDVWRIAGGRGFAIRRIIDARLGLSLAHHGVEEFATTNVKDFQGFGFRRVWNPCA